MYVNNGSIDLIPREIHEAIFEWLDMNASEMINDLVAYYNSHTDSNSLMM